MTRIEVREAIFNKNVQEYLGIHAVHDFYYTLDNYLEAETHLKQIAEQFKFAYDYRPYDTYWEVTEGDVEDLFIVADQVEFKVSIIFFQDAENFRRFQRATTTELHKEHVDWWKNHKKEYLAMLNNYIKENNLYGKKQSN